MVAWASQHIVAAALSGDKTAVEALIAAVWERCFRLAASVLCDRALAQDAAQEACVVLHRKVHTLRTAVYYDTEGNVSHVSNYNSNVIRVRDMVNVGMVVGLILATPLGGSLAKENDGHLAIVWLRPVSRTHYALVTMGISVVVVLAAELLTSAILLGAGMLTLGNGRGLDWTYAWAIPSAMLIPVAWYALLTASSASLRRGSAVVVGVAWACAFALLGASHASDAPAALTSIVGAINWVNPLHYVDSSAADAVRYAVALAALTIAYGATALFQWRRAEL